MGLLTSYSNRTDLLHELEIATGQLQQAQQEGTPSVRSVRSPDRKGRVWGLAERLSEEDAQLLIKEYHAGALRQELADKYKISLSSVGRLLRTYRGLLKDCSRLDNADDSTRAL